jgi:hypothetical protein
MLALVPALFFSMNSCSDSDDGEDGNVVFTANLSGQQEVPPNSSTAKGDATLTFNEITRTFNLVVTHNVTNPNAAHIHKGEPGVSGPPVFPLNPASPINYTSATLDSTQRADLFGGKYYVNVHTPEFPAGIIRGQLVRK